MNVSFHGTEENALNDSTLLRRLDDVRKIFHTRTFTLFIMVNMYFIFPLSKNIILHLCIHSEIALIGSKSLSDANSYSLTHGL